MPLIVLVVIGLVALVLIAAAMFFAYAHRRYHAVPFAARPSAPGADVVHVGGFDLFVRQLGPEGDVPIVVLHGGPGHSSLSFKDSLDFLAEGHHLVFYDQRGSGLSEVRPGNEHYTVDALVEELDALRRDVLEVEAIDLLGHSAGGALAQRYALKHSDRVRRVVLVGSTTANNNMSHALIWRTLGPGFYALSLGMPPADMSAADAWFGADQVSSDARRLFDPDNPAPILDSGPISFATWFAVSQSLAGTALDDELGALDVPVLVVYGEADAPYTGAKAARRMATVFQHATLVEVSRSGHWPFLENPTDFEAAVIEFLRP